MRPNKTKEGNTLAITKTWTVKDDLNRVLNYIKNPDKTTEIGDGEYSTHSEPLCLLQKSTRSII